MNAKKTIIANAKQAYNTSTSSLPAEPKPGR